MPKKKYDNPVSATWSGVINMFKKGQKFGEIRPEDTMAGKKVMITGANSGLGFASAVHLAKMGAEVIMACRSGIPQAAEKVKELSGAENVRMEYVDLSDLHSVVALVDRLEDSGIQLDVFISNAAVVPAGSKTTAQGLEQMMVVNYLAPFFLTQLLIERKILVQHEDVNKASRIIVVSSESHRSGNDLELESFFNPVKFTMKEVIAYYGYYKLALTTWVQELDRRLNKDQIKLPVYSLCPGAVNTNIAREAPTFFQPLLKLIFYLFFQTPEKAAAPVVYLSSTKDITNISGIYLHMWERKEVDERANEKQTGHELWERSLHKIHELGL
jgi:NAD(P)-dependent dehydrogenase (short-subunit alcohol dehydrogenase family)